MYAPDIVIILSTALALLVAFSTWGLSHGSRQLSTIVIRLRSSLDKLRSKAMHPHVIIGAVVTVLWISYLSSPRLVGTELRVSKTATGQYAALMDLYLQILGNADHRYRIQHEMRSSAGSTQTARQIVNDEADLGFVQANVSPKLLGERGSGLRAIATVYDEYFFLLSKNGNTADPLSLPNVLDSGNPFKVATLGKESQTFHDLKRLLGELGYSPYQYEIIPHEGVKGYEHAIGALREGSAQYAFFITGLANQDLAGALRNPQSDITLIPFTGHEALALRMPGTVASYVPAEYFGPGYRSEYLTIKTRAILACSSALPDDLVYELTRTLTEGGALLAQTFGMTLNIAQLQEAEKMLIPMHDGAIRYYHRDRPGFFSRNHFWISSIIGILGVAVAVMQLRKHAATSFARSQQHSTSGSGEDDDDDERKKELRPVLPKSKAQPGSRASVEMKP